MMTLNMKFNNYKPVQGAMVSDYCRFVWINKRDNYLSDDIDFYYDKLFAVKNISSEILGKVDDDNIYFVKASAQNNSNPNLLILGGVHGEEPAGAWGLLQFIRKLDAEYSYLLHKVNLYFIPVINSFGFKLGYRLNKQGLSVNSGYFDDQADIQTMEGNVLKNNFALLCQRDGRLCLKRAFLEAKIGQNVSICDKQEMLQLIGS